MVRKQELDKPLLCTCCHRFLSVERIIANLVPAVVVLPKVVNTQHTLKKSSSRGFQSVQTPIIRQSAARWKCLARTGCGSSRQKAAVKSSQTPADLEPSSAEQLASRPGRGNESRDTQTLRT